MHRARRPGISRRIFLLAVLTAAAACAQEFAGGYGLMSTPDASESTYAWQLEFRQNFSDHFSWSANWLNEGHIDGHHRDGVGAQLWGRQAVAAGKLAVAIGLGPYHYFDTQGHRDGSSVIARGWAPMTSLSVTYYTDSPWFFRLGVNLVSPDDEMTTHTALLSVGYSLWKEAAVSAPDAPKSADNELAAYGGRTIVNASVGEGAQAYSVEYRRRIAGTYAWSLAWLDEGDAGAAASKRDGIASQMWLTSSFLAERLELGLGAGVYYADQQASAVGGDAGGREFMPIVSPMMAYRFSDSWCARFVWHRVVSDYHRDADVFLIGAGRKW